jgi:sugar phosphate isomerase/epimerase
MDIICASICYRGFAADEVAMTLERAPAIGYRWMEVHGDATWTPPAVKVFDVAGVQARLKASGMKCAGIYSPCWGGRDAADVAQRAEAIASVVRFAEVLRAGHVTSTGASPRGEPGGLQRVIACVREVLGRIAAHTPVRLALEPHFGNVLERPEDFETVLAAVGDDPRLGLCVDTGHFHSAAVDTLGFIRRHASRIYNVHLKDHRGPVSVGIGRGEIDLHAVVDVLRKAGYAGGLTVELEVEDHENLPRYTQEAYVYLSGMLGQKL